MSALLASAVNLSRPRLPKLAAMDTLACMSTHPDQVLLDADGVRATIEHLTQQIAADLPADHPVGIIGIRRRGEVLARRLVKELRGRYTGRLDAGSLDITLYRDDLAELGPQAIVRRTEIDFDLSGRHIVLVDDVLYTGRSVRAALDAIIDLGRPRAIRLAVLVDRPGRELPIQADYVGIQARPAQGAVTVLLQEFDGIEEVRIA